MHYHPHAVCNKAEGDARPNGGATGDRFAPVILSFPPTIHPTDSAINVMRMTFEIDQSISLALACLHFFRLAIVDCFALHLMLNQIPEPAVTANPPRDVSSFRFHFGSDRRCTDHELRPRTTKKVM